MSSFCEDRDILVMEPIAFLGGGFDTAGQLVSGNDGVLSGTTFISACSDFVSAGITPGMVLCTTTTIPTEGSAWEIVSVDSATMLTVSILRANSDDSPVPPPAGSELSFYVRTFASRITTTSASLAEKLRTLAEAMGVSSADFVDSRQLRTTTVAGVLAGVFLARADNGRPQDANWIKADYYRNEFINSQNQLRLAVDINGDGTAESTRTLGNVTLRRV